MTRMRSTMELSRAAMFSAIMAIAEVGVFTFTWPAVPPIVIMPFVTSFLFALSLPFSRDQWIMGIVAAIAATAAKGMVLPGPLFLPIYGFTFQSGRARTSGAVASALHVIWGIIVAPIFLRVAPAKALLKWFMPLTGSMWPALMTAVAIYAVGGLLAAAAGYAVGRRVAAAMTSAPRGEDPGPDVDGPRAVRR